MNDRAAGSRDSADSVRLGLSTGDLAVLFIAVVIGCAVALPVLTWLAGVAAEPYWMPLRGPLQSIGSLNPVLSMVIGAGAGMFIGLATAQKALRETVRLTVTRDALTVEKSGATSHVSRADVAAVFLDGKQLVVVDRTAREVVRGPLESKPGRTGTVLREYGYPWRENDAGARP